MNELRLRNILDHFAKLRIAVVGDFCLDRYLEIDPAKQETSLETGLPVHNVVNIRSQPGGAGTILNNLSAVGIGKVVPVGFCGVDGHGFELREALRRLPGIDLHHFLQTDQRQTFCYCKPLVTSPTAPPVELNRLDVKNWTPTPADIQGKLIDSIRELQSQVDAFILMDQVDVPETGVISSAVLATVADMIKTSPDLIVLGDSRRRVKDFPPCSIKVNRGEFSAMTDLDPEASLEEVKEKAVTLARKQSRRVFVTLSENGLLGAFPNGEIEQVPAFPVRGAIDVVGAGDAVTANLTASLASGASLRECLEIANAAASIVIHQLGTTGTATKSQLLEQLVH